jgi:hypothetical protein
LNTAAAKNELKMMKGTGGHEDYLLVARKGNMVFGIKPLAAVPGAMKGVPGTAYFMARIRCAPAGDLFAETDDGTVVQFQQKFSKPQEAWPNFDWEKVDANRCSSIYSVFVKGALGEGAELEKILLEQIADKKVGKRFSAELVAGIGAKHLVVTPRQLTDFVDDLFTGAIKAAMKAHAEKKAMQNMVFDHIEDTFGAESKVLKNLYKKLHPNQIIEDAEVPDADADDGSADHADPDEI